MARADLLIRLVHSASRGDRSLFRKAVEALIAGEPAEEHHRGELLHSHNLEPRHRLLRASPPGNGKTSLAEALATELAVPLCVGRYEGDVASYLGETSRRLKRLSEPVRHCHCVLFFDELDTLGKERGEEHGPARSSGW